MAEQHRGPIDYTVFVLPEGARRFSDAMARELASLADAELIRVLDLVIVSKDDQGELTTIEFDRIERPGDLGALGPGLSQVLSPADIGSLTSMVTPGSAAGIVVWENTWATHLVLAAEESGGRVLTSGRIESGARSGTLPTGRRPTRSRPSP